MVSDLAAVTTLPLILAGGVHYLFFLTVVALAAFRQVPAEAFELFPETVQIYDGRVAFVGVTRDYTFNTLDFVPGGFERVVQFVVFS
jgi:hypothetical protein